MKSGINFTDFKISETSLLSYLVVAEIGQIYHLWLLFNWFSVYYVLRLKTFYEILWYPVIQTLVFNIVFSIVRCRLPRSLQSIIR